MLSVFIERSHNIFEPTVSWELAKSCHRAIVHTLENLTQECVQSIFLLGIPWQIVSDDVFISNGDRGYRPRGTHRASGPHPTSLHVFNSAIMSTHPKFDRCNPPSA
jgi:hypothetical protein